ncbi:hypothetical protein EMIT0P74_80302 [Pseudomonas sp. IT-P74]
MVRSCPARIARVTAGKAVNPRPPCRSELAREKPESATGHLVYASSLTIFASKLAPTEAKNPVASTGHAAQVGSP